MTGWLSAYAPVTRMNQANLVADLPTQGDRENEGVKAGSRQCPARPARRQCTLGAHQGVSAR